MAQLDDSEGRALRQRGSPTEQLLWLQLHQQLGVVELFVGESASAEGRDDYDQERCACVRAVSSSFAGHAR
jgi:hypothetical protein